ncbi:MAG: response regulator [Gemmatimonadota bacterium]|nr:response regulator [Gemmatimonadota bacterium]
MDTPIPRAAPPATRVSILLIEDEPDVGRTVSKILRREGYTVHWAERPHDAIHLASTLAEPVDLVVTDVVLPGMSGPEVAERIMEIRPRARVLYISGYLGDTVLEPGEAIFGEGLLLKPFSPGELVRRIRSILERPA